ncbi:PD40 domain-containing protein [Algoriphagus yeomjeoni]|uniref:WD40 repeat protein n=1 Tax=Algoriphagus yeomjeoni TaxID=291403 RepID=A0A327PGB6_9BACT|nr:PD40 domain-containing protein [Algoriphagus yeomjeoni]RAI90192.1 WD40 repeat protein [Algoriphagus yeomjeoni]
MKNIALLFVLILAFSSCQNFDDPIPDGSFLETPTLSTRLVDETSVELTWSSAQICNINCPSIVPASFYEVWTKSLVSSTNYKLVEIPAGQMSYLVEGLEPGVRQEFYVVAKRANVSNETNRVMVVPNELPASLTVFEKASFDYITHPQVSPDGTKVIYTISEAGSSIQPQQVFVFDLNSKSEKLISEKGQYPSWSANGESLIFVVGDQNISALREYTVASGESEEIISDSFQSYFPVFGVRDTTLIYFLDSLDEGDQSIILFNLDEEATNPKRTLRDVDDIENIQMPILGMTYSTEENNVAYSVTFAKDTPVGFSYDVVGFAVNSPTSLRSFVVSDWNDSNPSFSPTNSELLAFVSDRSGTNQLWIRNTITGKLYQVTDFQESERINVGIVGLSWSEEKLYINIQETSGVTRLVSLDVSSLLN